MQPIRPVQPLRHLLELLTVPASFVQSEVRQVVVNHLMDHDVAELAFSKVIIVSDRYFEIIQFLAEPHLTIATL